MIKTLFKTIFKFLLLIIYIISFIIFTYYIFKIDIIPFKYLLLGYSIFAILSIIIFILFITKHLLSSFILIAIVAFLLNGSSLYFKNTLHFLNNINSNLTNSSDKLNYYIITLNNNNYNTIQDLDMKKIGYLKEDKNNINTNLLKTINYEEVLYDDFNELQYSLYNNSLDAICLLDSYLYLIYDEVDNFKDNTKLLYNFSISNSIEVMKEIDKNNYNPFILYISGIDQYGEIKSIRGRSDVNILAVINPLSNHVLLVNTPRDYYVQLSGTTGLKDKLTHAGIYGIDKSMETLENLYDITIDNYVRINFDSLIKVVDVIGGIDVYSDTEFSRGDILVKEGLNHFNGEQALAYARERYAYKTGDNHRGQNQQQIITAIIDKISKSSVLISKYNSILDSLSNTFQTDIQVSDMISLIKYQLKEMPSWQIDSIQVTGYDSKNYTYSMGKSKLLYVMEPNYDTIKVAKERIISVLNEE